MKPDLSVIHLANPQALRDCAEQWDDLWLRSDVTHPTAQAPLIANWLDHYLQREQFRAVVVSRGNQFLAALPLVTRTKGHVVQCMDVPGNEWSSAGQLLIDPLCDIDAVCDTLVAELCKLSCSAFWFASVPIDARWWQALVAAARRADWSVEVRRRYQVGRLKLQPTWAEQSELLSKGMRKKLRRSARRLEVSGPVRLHVARPSRGDSVLGVLETGLALEHVGWKGTAGTSVLANPRVLRFLQDQARQLIAKQQLAVALLEQNGRNIAFEYGWCAKQVYHSCKVAYDEQAGHCSPGQLMIQRLQDHFRVAQDIHAFDFLGPVDAAVCRWQPQLYSMGRLLLAPPKPMGRALVFASRYFMTGSTSPVLN